MSSLLRGSYHWPRIARIAAEKGNLREFERLFTADEKRLQFRDSRGRAAVHHAAAHNKVNILDFILKHNGDLGMLDYEDNSPLHSACEHEAADAISFLIDNGADTSLLNKNTQSPLHVSTQLNKVKSLQALVKHKDKVDTNLRSKHGRTALHLAAIYDHAECARILLSQFGASPKITCDNGFYPIHEAAKNASANAIEALLEWDLGMLDYEDNSPLHSACEHEAADAISFLIDNGADTSLLNKNTQSPLHVSTQLNKVKSLQALVKHKDKVDTNLRSKHGRTALHLAAIYDHAECARILLSQFGASPKITCDNGFYPIHEAAKNASANAIEALLEWGKLFLLNTSIVLIVLVTDSLRNERKGGL
ncbi:transient receptor potential cation channel subfamily A member 1-like [Ixodes scapularis]